MNKKAYMLLPLRSVIFFAFFAVKYAFGKDDISIWSVFATIVNILTVMLLSSVAKKEGMSFDDLIMDFTPEERELLNIVFTENKLIPQEIIPYTLLSER